MKLFNAIGFALAIICSSSIYAQTHLITSTSGSSLTGSFSFGGSLASDGTFNFDSSGNPLSEASIVVTYVVSMKWTPSVGQVGLPEIIFDPHERR